MKTSLILVALTSTAQAALAQQLDDLDRAAHQREVVGDVQEHGVDADVTKYFDTIPHAELMQSVARRVADGKILHLRVGGGVDLDDVDGARAAAGQPRPRATAPDVPAATRRRNRSTGSSFTSSSRALGWLL